MPSGPPNGYNSGSYPAPDQGNGISIYNSGAPESPGGQGGYQQGANNPQQLQPANGSQPPNYDAPLQTAAAQPSVAPSQAPHSAAPPQPQPSQAQQQPEQPQQQNDTQQADQHQQQCRAASAQLGNIALPSGGGRGVLIGLRKGGGSWKLDPAPPPNPSCTDCQDTAQKQTQDQLKDIQQQLDQERSKNRQLTCKQTKDFTQCPELLRKEVPGHCEATFNNPTPLCNLNLLDTKYCEPGEAAWLIYSHWADIPFSWGFDAPKKMWDYFKKPSEYETKCLKGQP